MAATDPQSIHSRRDGFPSLDGLRAVAAVLVLLTHTSFLTTGNQATGGSFLARMDSGVSIFFVISGFLLYRPFVLAALSGVDRPAVGPYLFRRFLRIYPAYWVAAIVMSVAFAHHPYEGLPDALGHLALVHIYSRDAAVSGPIPQAWSLATEVSFYVALPVLAVLAAAIAARTARRLGPQLVFVGALVAAGVAFRWWTGATQGPMAAFYATWLPGYIDQFALGMGLAVLSAWSALGNRLPRIFDSRRLAAASWVAAGTVFAYAALGAGLPTSTVSYSASQQLIRQGTYAAFGALLVLPAALGPDRGLVHRFLRAPGVRHLGLVSYGVYLWHHFLLVRFQRLTGTPEFGGGFGPAVAFVLAAAVLIAATSYLVVERPVLSLKRRWPDRGRAPAAPAVAS